MAAARENAALTGLPETSVRWLTDDALKFMRREVRRGSKYHGILLDPPKYGRGPDGEIWTLERDLPELMHLARQLLADDAAFLVLTVYAIRMSALALQPLLAEVMAGAGREHRGRRHGGARGSPGPCPAHRHFCALEPVTTVHGRAASARQALTLDGLTLGPGLKTAI